MEPIKDYNLIFDISDYLRSRNVRDYVLFSFGIYLPIRISDILMLKVRDVKNRKVINVREKKTGKEQRLKINKKLQDIIKYYIEDMKDYEYLFPSKKYSGNGNQKAISRQQAYNILSDAGRAFGLHSVGCHSMRKTFGYHYYQQTKDIMKLQQIFNHPDPNTTKHYIGLIQEDKDDTLYDFEYKPLK